MTSLFLTKLESLYEEKESILCVGLDPAIPGQREKNIIASNDRLKFMHTIIEQVAPYSIAVKPNRQYLMGLTTSEMKEITKKAKGLGLITIMDHKLSDIGSTNDSALYWIKKEGFDGLTFSPFAGNTRSTSEKAHELGLGVIVLTLMSNPEAKWMIKEKIEGKTIYQFYAEEVRKYADGAVVGATGHVTNEHIKEIKVRIGKKIILAPGVGAQGGDAEKLIKICGKELLINVGRDIIYSEKPALIAEKYDKQFKEVMKNNF
jgi:orotidine-5'-phosphate decarboxylase